MAHLKDEACARGGAVEVQAHPKETNYVRVRNLNKDPKLHQHLPYPEPWVVVPTSMNIYQFDGNDASLICAAIYVAERPSGYRSHRPKASKRNMLLQGNLHEFVFPITVWVCFQAAQLPVIWISKTVLFDTTTTLRPAFILKVVS